MFFAFCTLSFASFAMEGNGGRDSGCFSQQSVADPPLEKHKQAWMRKPHSKTRFIDILPSKLMLFCLPFAIKSLEQRIKLPEYSIWDESFWHSLQVEHESWKCQNPCQGVIFIFKTANKERMPGASDLVSDSSTQGFLHCHNKRFSCHAGAVLTK